MRNRKTGGIRWGAVSLGWVAAVLAGFAINPFLRSLYGLLAESPGRRGDFTLAIVVVSLLSGFLAYLIGGYVAAKQARGSGGTNGAMTAVFGLLVGSVLAIILTVFGMVFPEGVALPPAGFGFDDEVLLAGVFLFLVNLFGGFVGGKLGEPSPENKNYR